MIVFEQNKPTIKSCACQKQLLRIKNLQRFFIAPGRSRFQTFKARIFLYKIFQPALLSSGPL